MNLGPDPRPFVEAGVGAIQHWLEWSRNPCGKEPLRLGALTRLEELSSAEPRLSCFSLGRPSSEMRKAMLTNLEGAFHRNADFPGRVDRYYEGWHPAAPDQWMIVIYGVGKRFKRRPEPFNPMKDV